MYVHIYTQMYICVCKYVYVYICVCLNLCMHVYLLVRLYVCGATFVCVFNTRPPPPLSPPLPPTHARTRTHLQMVLFVLALAEEAFIPGAHGKVFDDTIYSLDNWVFLDKFTFDDTGQGKVSWELQVRMCVCVCVFVCVFVCVRVCARVSG